MELSKAESGSWLLRYFGRKTSGGAYIPELDGLRFIAIISVFVFHCNGVLMSFGDIHDPNFLERSLYNISIRGGLGVKLFFVLSGFILAYPFAEYYAGKRPAIPLKAYFVRRITRLEPPYIIAILLFFVLGVVMKGSAFVDTQLGPSVVSLFYLNSAVYGDMLSYNPVIWSLEVEVQFYCLAPFLAMVYKLDVLKRWALLLGAIVIFTYINTDPSWAPFTNVFQFIQYFLVGFLIVDLYRSPKVIKSYAWDIVTVVVTAGTLYGWIHRSGYGVNDGYLLAAMFLLCMGIFKGRLFSKLLSWPLITVIGGMCYTIYLLHFPIVAFVGRWLASGMGTVSYLQLFVVNSLIILVAVLILSFVYFKLIERPCMDKDWVKKLTAKLRSIKGGSA